MRVKLKSATLKSEFALVLSPQLPLPLQPSAIGTAPRACFTAQLGIDYITAVTPEPTTFLLFAGGLAAGGFRADPAVAESR